MLDKGRNCPKEVSDGGGEVLVSRSSAEGGADGGLLGSACIWVYEAIVWVWAERQMRDGHIRKRDPPGASRRAASPRGEAEDGRRKQTKDHTITRTFEWSRKTMCVFAIAKRDFA
jgi:hypothetical protein